MTIMTFTEHLVWSLAKESYMYVQDGEPMLVVYSDDINAVDRIDAYAKGYNDYFLADGLGYPNENYRIAFADVDLSTDKFFKLVEVKP
tara:strand:+ start:527 stop:790 length:264 start_codon:yes stop_codon:yes gene_type:complete